MHELSIALNLIELVEEEARKAGCLKVFSVDVAVGLLSGIDPEALIFSITLAKENSLLSDAVIHLHRIEGSGRCRSCNNIFPVNAFHSTCPECKSNAVELIAGDDLKLISLEAE
jgi:hydrogenase nickel incorporation protein HypA/HybF